ncbi:MAG: twin-arginine translocation signal domain-containing protein, partial [Nitrosomonas sp.]|nr:twin-arginine translocation signal domain-containing protein [Nitrosomonas sp.]
MPDIDYKRRQFLQYSALGTLAAALPGFAFADNRVINKT